VSARQSDASTEDRKRNQAARRRKRAASGPDHDDQGGEQSAAAGRHAPLDDNVKIIARWERDTLHSRSPGERFADWLIYAASRELVVLLHAVWFTVWIAWNSGVGGLRPFDEFPFPLLTMVVSLEAIFLSLFLLSSQNRLSRQADKRAHLDLQIDLLAEQEMTVVLRLLHDIADHLGAKVSVTPEQVRDLARMTDLHKLTDKLEEIEESATGTRATNSTPAAR
jgi:uncharacterized membrane protein